MVQRTWPGLGLGLGGGLGLGLWGEGVRVRVRVRVRVSGAEDQHVERREEVVAEARYG